MRRSREEEQARRRRLFRLAYLARVRSAIEALTHLVSALEGGAQDAPRLLELEGRIARLTDELNLDVMAAACRKEIPDETHDAATGGPVVLRRAS
jgi:hypothetical protein